MTAATSPIRAKHKTPVEVSWENVTPTRAKLWLKQTAESSFEQRNLGPSTVKRYTGEMLAGTWHPCTADIIRIGICDGMEVVIDGQHRLQAIANSQESQDMFVARGVPLEAFKYIDQGAPRSLKDVMDCAGWDASNTLATAGRYLWVYSETGTPFGDVKAENRLSAGSLFDWVKEYVPSLQDTWSRDHDAIRKARKGVKMSEGIMTFLWMKMCERDPMLASSVFMFLANPLDRNLPLPSEYFQWAVAYLNEVQYEMREMNKKGMKTRSDEHRDPCTSALIFAWNRTRQNKKVRSLTGFKKQFNAAEWDELWTIS